MTPPSLFTDLALPHEEEDVRATHRRAVSHGLEITRTEAHCEAHALMCGSGANSNDFPEYASCHLVAFDGSTGNHQLYTDPAPLGDWDSGYYKGECAKGEYVEGVAQTTSDVVDGRSRAHCWSQPSG